MERSVENVSGSFSVDTGDRWEMNRDPMKIKPGDKCVVKINGQTMITGWVDGSSRNANSASHSVTVSGRDVTCDIVDCSAVVRAFELKNVTLGKLASQLCAPFGIPVKDESGDREVFATVAIQPGETVWECLDRQARQRNVSVVTDGKGMLLLCRLGGERAKDKLVLGENLLQGAVEFDETGLYSRYTVKAQMPPTGESGSGWNESKHAVEASTADTGVKRYRPLIITAEAQSYEKSAALRAEREKRRRVADAVEVSAEVAGWTQSDGSLWPLGALVGFEAPALGFSSADFIIASISNAIDEGGIKTTLRLKHPDAFLSEETRNKKKAKGKKATENYNDYWGD